MLSPSNMKAGGFRMPRTAKSWAGFAKVNVQGPGENAIRLCCEKVAAENGLLPCIEPLDPIQAGKGLSIKLPDWSGGASYLFS